MARDLERRKERREAQIARNGERRRMKGKKGKMISFPSIFLKSQHTKKVSLFC